jgi:hypothetical protein
MNVAGLLLIASLAAPALAQAASPEQCTRTWNEEMAAHSTGGDSYKTFMIACLHNRTSPTAPRVDRPVGAPASATARCRDGVYSYSSDPAQACMQHRGVQALLR